MQPSSSPDAPTHTPPAPTAIQQLMAMYLRDPRILFFPHAPIPKIVRAICLSARGLDHLGSESFIGMVAAKDVETLLGSVCVLTDRRVFGTSGKYMYSVPFDSLHSIGVEPDELFSQRAVFQMLDGQKVTAAHSDALQPFMQFLHAVTQVHPSARTSERIGLVKPTYEDPTGAHGATPTLMWPDARIVDAINYVETAARMGKVDNASAIDAVRRLLILNRTQFWGRGQSGVWLSPLAATDLPYALACVMGAPAGHWTEGDTTVFDVLVRGRYDDARDEGPTIRSGLAQMVERIRATVVPMKTASAFRLEHADKVEDKKPLAVIAPRTFQRIHEGLLHFEAQITFLRAMLGWEMPVDRLWVEGPALAAERARTVLSAS